MFCTKCGTDLPDDSRFCRSCGQTLGSVSTGGGAAAAPARIATPAKPKNRFTYWQGYTGILECLSTAESREVPLGFQQQVLAPHAQGCASGYNTRVLHTVRPWK
jgi:zinc-ribbon domain